MSRLTTKFPRSALFLVPDKQRGIVDSSFRALFITNDSLLLKLHINAITYMSNLQYRSHGTSFVPFSDIPDPMNYLTLF